MTVFRVVKKAYMQITLLVAIAPFGTIKVYSGLENKVYKYIIGVLGRCCIIKLIVTLKLIVYSVCEFKIMLVLPIS